MTPEELDRAAGVKKDPESTPSKPTVIPLEEYEKVVKSYENIRSAYDKRDEEIRSLREKASQKPADPVKKLSLTEVDLDDPEEVEAIKAAFQKIGLTPSTEDDVEKRVERAIRIKDATLKLQTDLAEASKKYAFVDQQAVLDFIGKTGNITVEQALLLMYRKELGSTPPPEVPVTDSNRRTLVSEGALSANQDTKLKPVPFKARGGQNTGIRDFIADRLGTLADNLTSNR